MVTARAVITAAECQVWTDTVMRVEEEVALLVLEVLETV